MAILPHDRGDYEPIGSRSGIPGSRIVTLRSAGAQQMELWEQTMPPGGEIPFHYHECEESLTFLSGQVEVTLDEETAVVEADTTVFVPPHTLHRIRNVGDEPVRLLAFFPAKMPAVLYPA